MEFLEKDLEEIIYLSDKDKLSDKGLYLHGNLKRQFKIGNYGICDLIEFKRPYCMGKTCFKGEINIIELKKEKIGVSTFFQAINYMRGIQSYLDKRDIQHLFNYKITLIGRQVDINSSFCYLGNILWSELDMTNIYDESKFCVELYKFSYDIDGVEFKQISGYKLINEGF